MTGSEPATDAAVEVRGVSKWFGETTALDQVDLTVGRGDVHGLLGPNGAGKTTLLSALFGLALPDEGTIRLFDRTRPEAGAAWLDGVGGFVETPRFYPYLSGRRNLAVLAGLDGGDADTLVEPALERAGLDGAAARKKVRGYSLGMRQRLGLAAAMLRRPRLLILDEPANGMDPAGIRDLRAALRRVARDGVSVILSSHDMAQVEETCDSATILLAGRVVAAGRIDALRAAAPDPVWRLRTSDDVRALSVAAAMTAVKAAAGDGGLIVHAAQDEMDGYVLALGTAAVAVRGLELDRTPLEALFFQLTSGSASVPGRPLAQASAREPQPPQMPPDQTSPAGTEVST